MGISEARMTKLMEGRAPGRPGVAGKVGELLQTVGGGRWCEQQGSLMRGFAFGILDPRGERYRLARLHQRECPACRAYVLTLRGLAAVLPPLPSGLGLGCAFHVASARVGHSIRTPPIRTTSANAGAKAGAGGGAVAATGAAGAAGAGGAAGGSWLLGGSVGAKLAVGCLLALSVGCVALTAAPHHADGADRGHPHRQASAASAYLADAPSALGGSAALSTSLAGSTLTGAASGRSYTAVARHISPTAHAAAVRRAADVHAQREFGLEQSAAATAAASSSARLAPATARAASVASAGATESVTSAAGSPAGSVAAPRSKPSGPPSRAEQEFGPE
jgi:hypothetical protein